MFGIGGFSFSFLNVGSCISHILTFSFLTYNIWSYHGLSYCFLHVDLKIKTFEDAFLITESNYNKKYYCSLKLAFSVSLISLYAFKLSVLLEELSLPSKLLASQLFCQSWARMWQLEAKTTSKSTSAARNATCSSTPP